VSPCARLRDAPYTYFIMVTQLHDKAHALEGLQAGVDDYLSKPVERDHLELRLIAAERVCALHRELATRAARRETLLRLARRLAAEADPTLLLVELLAEAVAVLGATHGLLAQWDEAQGRLMLVRSTLDLGSEPRALSLEQGASGQAAARRAPVILNEYPRQLIGALPAPLAGIQAAVAAPLLHEGRLLGTLAVASLEAGRQFTPEDAAVLELLASLGAAALVGLERARLDGVLLAAHTAEHELNNRLALTVGWAELLARHPRLPPELLQPATEALRGSQEAATLVQQLLQITRIAETAWGPGITTIDLAQSTG
jgi:GAF domain-containing protein